MRKFPGTIFLFILACWSVPMFLHLNFCNKCVCQIHHKHLKHINAIKVMDHDYHISPLQKSKEQLPDHKCKLCHVDEPRVVIQYGPPRTASTLQFQILCLMMALLHQQEVKSVGCHFNKIPSHKYSVIKTHGVKYFFESLTQSAWIFMTTGKDLPLPKWQLQLVQIKQKLKYLNMTVRYISDIDLVSKRGHFVAYEYQSIFGLTDNQMTYVVEYLRYWDILRLCCGRQMSLDWRNSLSPIPDYTKHHDVHNRTYPACEMHDISKVEKLFINTYIYSRFSHITALHDVIGKPSNIDGKLDGHYCERCNKNITKYHITKTGERCV